MSALVVGLGCAHNRPIEARSPIAVPPGLAQEQVEWAIVSALLSRKGAAEIPPHFQTGSAGQALVWEEVQKMRAEDAEDGWFPEARYPGRIVAAYQKGDHYLELAIDYNGESVSTRILSSRNLNQNGNVIHHRALEWIDELEWRIRRNLGMIAVQVPSAPPVSTQ
jgi:hypothetical protein